MRKRNFLFGLAGTLASPPVGRAQQPERMRRIGVLMPLAPDDAEGRARLFAFEESLHALGWALDGDVQIDYRWGAGSIESIRSYAAELVALAPDVILAPGTAPVGPLIQATRTVPIVFVHVVDPVGAGFVNSLAEPGGNATGFVQFEYGISGKWLEVLKQIEPNLSRVAVIRDPGVSSGTGQFGAIQSIAPSLGVETRPVSVRDVSEIERELAAFARRSDGGLIVTASALAAVHRDAIIQMAARHRLGAVYYDRNFVAAGGLICYGPDLVDQYKRAAAYVDKILKGEKPATMPVLAPTKYDLAINLKTAKALGSRRPVETK